MMQVHFGIELLKAEWPSAVACLGTFDGVHRGHQTVISAAVQHARERGLPCVLVTFDRHPASVLAPDRCPPSIAPLSLNLRQIESLGISAAVILPFTHELSQTTATDFLAQVLIEKAHATELVVGHDFAFGRGREGTTAWLKDRIATSVVPPFEIDGQRVSSTIIRSAIERGDMEQVAHWLGRPFEIEGVVVGGQRLGRELGFPTINLARAYDGVVPADGIYSGKAHTSLGSFDAAISIGMRPTVNGSNRTIEAYLLNFPPTEIYGYSVRLEVRRWIRNELKFDSLEALKEQMARDVEMVANSR